MASHGDDDLVASKTEGYKVGEKKTVEEYAKLGRSHRKTVVGVSQMPLTIPAYLRGIM